MKKKVIKKIEKKPVLLQCNTKKQILKQHLTVDLVALNSFQRQLDVTPTIGGFDKVFI